VGAPPIDLNFSVKTVMWILLCEHSRGSLTLGSQDVLSVWELLEGVLRSHDGYWPIVARVGVLTGTEILKFVPMVARAGVQVSNTRIGGASKTRSMAISRSERVVTFARLLFSIAPREFCDSEQRHHS